MMKTKIQTYEQMSLSGTKGIFQSLFNEIDFLSSILGTSEQCEIEFMTKYLSRKLSTFSNYVVITFGTMTTDDEFDGLTTVGINRVVSYIKTMFISKWQGLYDLSNRNYDPLKPFDITLSEKTIDKLDTRKDSSTYQDNDDTYGFNSTEAVPMDKSSGSSSREYARDIDRSRDYTRKGNIGNTSFQDLIKQEREILDYRIKEVIFKDIASIICRGKYI